MVGVALRPLRRVAATATRVSELPLHSGEVALFERVPDAEADPRTEVGQVGAALNRMLGHVGSALDARQKSEMRVRQFVADASHELRTPLASIRGYAELTRRGREDAGPDTRHALGRIESEAERMTGMVEDLLLLARLDAGRPLSYESTDLSPLVIDAVSDARAAAGRRPGIAGPTHHWRLELPEVPATVRADPTRIQQVLVNLLANARTHTPPGTTVTVRVREARRGLPWVTLEVQDDGPGIPAELQPHVFERFARGDASRSRHAGSTGWASPSCRPSSPRTADWRRCARCRGARCSPSICRRWCAVYARGRCRLTGPPQAHHKGVTARLASVVSCEPTLWSTLPAREHLLAAAVAAAGAPVLDVVVPVYNEEKDLETCVLRLHDHLARTFPYRFRITVADNASTDRTPRWRPGSRRTSGGAVVAAGGEGPGAGAAHRLVPPDAQVLAYMDVDLSTDLDALLPWSRRWSPATPIWPSGRGWRPARAWCAARNGVHFARPTTSAALLAGRPVQ